MRASRAVDFRAVTLRTAEALGGVERTDLDFGREGTFGMEHLLGNLSR
jgi:hypothetical protein